MVDIVNIATFSPAEIEYTACLPLSCLDFRPPHEKQHSAACERGGENRRVCGVPSPALRDKAEAYAGEDCRGVGEDPDEPSRHASGSRRRLLSGRDTQKRLGTVDEKAYRLEWQQFHRKRRRRRHRPECGYGRRRIFPGSRPARTAWRTLQGAPRRVCFSRGAQSLLVSCRLTPFPGRLLYHNILSVRKRISSLFGKMAWANGARLAEAIQNARHSNHSGPTTRPQR